MSLKIRKAENDTLSANKILEIIKDFEQNELTEFQGYKAYYKGDNVTITNKPDPMSDSPNNKIPIPYARKLVKTVVGYMFKPGFVTYDISEVTDKTKSELKAIAKNSKDPIMASQLGRDMSNFGVAYEHIFLDGNIQLKYIKMSPLEIIPIWDYSIDPNLKFIIRRIVKNDTKYITVYSDTAITEYYISKDSKDRPISKDRPEKLIKIGETEPNIFGVVPFNIYQNTEDYQNDYYHIIPLIDAYDNLMSGSMNEFDRFAYAYLLLVKMKLSTDDTKDIKNKRIFENLENKDAVSFLTKDIPIDFIQWMTDQLRKEIHTQSHIPDFKEDSTGKTALSGEALDRLLYDFEFIAADKEAYFKDGVNTRVGMLLDILQTLKRLSAADYEGIELNIKMKRNTPRSRKEDAALYNAYIGKGITTETLIQNFAPFVDDPGEELKEFQKEQDVYRENPLDEEE